MPNRQSHRLTPQQEERVVAKYLDGTVSVDALGREYGFEQSPSTLYRILRSHGVEPGRGRGGVRVKSPNNTTGTPDHAVPAAVLSATDNGNGAAHDADNGGPRRWRVVVEVDAATAPEAIAPLARAGEVVAIEVMG